MNSRVTIQRADDRTVVAFENPMYDDPGVSWQGLQIWLRCLRFLFCRMFENISRYCRNSYDHRMLLNPPTTTVLCAHTIPKDCTMSLHSTAPTRPTPSTSLPRTLTRAAMAAAAVSSRLYSPFSLCADLDVAPGENKAEDVGYLEQAGRAEDVGYLDKGPGADDEYQLPPE